MLLSYVHVLSALPAPTTGDKVILRLQAEITLVESSTIARELSDYCLHIRRVLGEYVDVAS
jgi:hypothetical protein